MMRRGMGIAVGVATLCAFSACKGDSGDDAQQTATGDGDGDGDGTGDGDGDGDGDGAGDGDGDGDGQPRLDVAAGDGDGDGDGTEICEHVDAIFAFDTSGSMDGEIAAMSDADLFATFRDTMLDAGNGLTDFQLAIMDDLPSHPYYHDNSGSPNDTDCNFSTGANYMTSLSPDFDQEFECIFEASGLGFAHVGTYAGPGGDTPIGPGLDHLQNAAEMPARSAGLSLSHPMAMDINDGFLRDDAVLFVLTITDEDDEIFVDGELVKNPPPEDMMEQMQEVHDQLVAAKGGDPNKVVFLGIGAGSDGCVGPYGDTIREAEHLQYLVSLFEADGQGVFHDLCEGNLEDSILEVLEIVDESCEEFDPEG